MDAAAACKPLRRSMARELHVRIDAVGDGRMSTVLVTGSSDGIDFRSREYSDVTRRPELVLTY